MNILGHETDLGLLVLLQFLILHVRSILPVLSAVFRIHLSFLYNNGSPVDKAAI